jgi:hypothetical protein
MSAPDEIHGVSQSQFSVARHFGGCTFQGRIYVYDKDRDVLVREDIHKKRLKEDKSFAAKVAADEKEKWMAVKKQIADAQGGLF